MPTIRARRASRVRRGALGLRGRSAATPLVRHGSGNTRSRPRSRGRGCLMATEAPTMRRTPLYDKHAELGAKMVPFAGYEMPIQYEGIVAEHRAVRGRAGLFDLSHMGEFFFRGRGAGETLDRLVSSDIARLAVGQARYGLLTNERGTIVDDVIVYRLADDEYLMVVNAANIAKDFRHLQRHLPAGVGLDDRPADTALIASQGPRAPRTLAPVT